MAGRQCSGIINLLFDGFADNTRGHFTRYDATRKISARIICKIIE